MSCHISDYNLAFITYYFLVDGFLESLVYYASIPMFLFTHGMSIENYQAALVLIMAPKCYRVVFGILSESVPIAGYHKYWYAVAGLTIIMVAAFGIMLVSSVSALVAFFALLTTGITLVGTLFDGTCIALIRISSTPRGMLMLQCILVALGYMVSVVLTGSIATTRMGEFPLLFSAGVVIAVIIGIQVVRSPDAIFPYDSVHIHDVAEDNLLSIEHSVGKKRIKHVLSAAEYMLGLFVVLMASGTTAVLSTVTDTSIVSSLVITIALSIMMLASVFIVYSKEERELMKLLVFVFLYEVLYIDITAAMSIYYTAKGSCIDGPAFSWMFYIGWTQLISLIMSLVVLVIYTAKCKTIGGRSAILVGNMVRIYGSFTDIAIAKRWNIHYGISDTAFYVLGDAMVDPAASTLVYLMITLVSVSLIVPGKETFVRAFFLSMIAMGQNVSRVFGLFLGYSMGISASLVTEECNYTNYVSLIVLSHIVIPSAIFPIAFFLLQDTPAIKEIDKPVEMKTYNIEQLNKMFTIGEASGDEQEEDIVEFSRKKVSFSLEVEQQQDTTE